MFKTLTEYHMLRQQAKEAAQKHSGSTVRFLERCVIDNKSNKVL